MPRYLASADAARVLNVTPAAVRAMARSGRLVPAIRTAGGIQLFDADEVQALAERRAAVIAVAVTAHSAS